MSDPTNTTDAAAAATAPVSTSFLVTVKNDVVNAASEASAVVVADAKQVLADVDGVYVDDIKPAFQNLVNKVIPDEIAALTPFAKEAFTEIVEDAPAFFAGGIASFAAAVGPMLASTFAKATAAGITVAKTDALTAVNAVIADAKVSVMAAAAPNADSAAAGTVDAASGDAPVDSSAGANGST